MLRFNPLGADTSTSLSVRSLSEAEGPVPQAPPGVIQIELTSGFFLF